MGRRFDCTESLVYLFYRAFVVLHTYTQTHTRARTHARKRKTWECINERAVGIMSSLPFQRLLRKHRGGGGTFARLLSSSSTSSSSVKENFLENLVRESNASFPNLEGKVVSGIVTKIDSKNGFIDVDVGFKMPSSFVKEELPEDVKIGDRVPLRVKRLQNPFGEMDVDSASVDQFRKHQLAWDAIARKREKRELVSGRILNAVNGGFAVGVTGHVGLLPKNLARDEKGRRLGQDRTPPIGEAMQFRVLSMSEAGGARNFVVSGPEVETKRQSNFMNNNRATSASSALTTKSGKVRTWDGTK